MILNKKGQTLIVFIVLLPLLLGVVAFVVDVGLICSKNAHLREVTKNIIENVYEDYEGGKVKNLYIKNNIQIDKLEVVFHDGELRIKNENEIESIFGKIVGLKKYKIKVSMLGYKEEDKLVIKRGD